MLSEVIVPGETCLSWGHQGSWESVASLWPRLGQGGSYTALPHCHPGWFWSDHRCRAFCPAASLPLSSTFWAIHQLPMQQLPFYLGFNWVPRKWVGCETSAWCPGAHGTPLTRVWADDRDLLSHCRVSSHSTMASEVSQGAGWALSVADRLEPNSSAPPVVWGSFHKHLCTSPHCPHQLFCI